ncbi:mechanosensitive ion channel family protein [Aquipuribacter sp. SD81]|uniref:mechanosensitive ion channel family protein n=1 Tax=Aquipuribacter sp. SD81 TaxID=3127703 RepID=UPI0030193E13
MTEPLNAAWVTVADFVPRLVAFLLILVVGWVLARLLAKAVDKVLERVGFDRAVERGGIARALQRSRYDASTIVSKLVFYALLLLVLQLAFGVFGPNPVSELLTGIIAFLPRLVVAIVIVVVAAAIASAVKDLIAGTLGGLSYGRALATIASVFIIGIGVIAALNQVGIATTVTTPVLIAVLATIGGILVVGVGGGLVRPMQSRWEGYLDTAGRETENVKREVERTRADRAAEAALEQQRSEQREAQERAAQEREAEARRAHEEEQARQAERARQAEQEGRGEPVRGGQERDAGSGAYAAGYGAREDAYEEQGGDAWGEPREGAYQGRREGSYDTAGDSGYDNAYGGGYGSGYGSYEDLERPRAEQEDRREVDLTDDATQPQEQQDRRW